MRGAAIDAGAGCIGRRCLVFRGSDDGAASRIAAACRQGGRGGPHAVAAGSCQRFADRHPPRASDAYARDDLLLKQKRIEILQDPETGRQACSQSIRLAGLHRLTAYDASYLELALRRRRRLPLATLDAALARAATAEGVTVLP